MATATLVATAPREDSPNEELLRVQTDPDELELLAQDAAAMRGSGAAGLLVPRSEGQLAGWLRANPDAPLLAQGALTSLTGGATPSGDVVVSLRRMTSLHVDEGSLRAKVGAGLVLADLQQALSERGLYYPPAPTHDGASIGGNASTNAAGAATFKYGTTRDWIEGLRVVLRSGDVLSLRRGEHRLEPGDCLRIEGSRSFEIVVPSYRSPALKKSSAGYYAGRPWDPVDLFVGAEGTLGIITEVEIRLLPRPAVMTGLVFAGTVKQALALADSLRRKSLEARSRPGARGLDVRSIEYFDRRCLMLVREAGKLSQLAFDVPGDAAACLLFEQELHPDEASSDEVVDRLSAAHEGRVAPGDPVGELMAVLMEHELVDRTELALPSDTRRKRQLAEVREAIPLCVSDWLKERQKRHPSVHKTAGDMIVPFDRFEEMLSAYYETMRGEGVDVAVFGHISDGNVHPNALPRDDAEMARAKRALLALAARAKALGGCPLSEHGVGKHPLKKQMLSSYWGPAVMDEMRAVKSAFDPGWTLGRGVLFDHPEGIGGGAREAGCRGSSDIEEES